MLHSICQQIWKIQQWPKDWKRSVFIPIPKKDNTKGCSNYHTITLILHGSKVMLKIFQGRLQPSWVLKNWCFWTVLFEKIFERPLNCKEIKPVNPKGNQPRIFVGRTDVEAETPNTLATWCESWLICKDPDAEKDWRQEEKGPTEVEIVGWHHRLNGHEFWVNSWS